MNFNESIKLKIEVDPYRTRTMKGEEDEIRTLTVEKPRGINYEDVTTSVRYLVNEETLSR